MAEQEGTRHPARKDRPTGAGGRKTAAHRRRARRRRTFLLGGGLVSLSLGVALGFFAFLARDVPPLDLAAFTDLSAASLVYARDGSLLGRFASAGDRRPLRCLADAGKVAPAAFIAAEDKDFYRHPGIDPAAILRSIWNNVRRRRITSGASTITQQTVKLAMFPRQERTWRRKLQEMALALELERKQSKSQILLEYLNALYFGEMRGVPVYGIESAALHSFGMPARALSPAQAALLAALPNNPAALSPWRHPQAALSRQRWILERMLEVGSLTPKECAAALREPVLGELSRDTRWIAPYESRTPFIVAAVSRLAPPLIAHALHISEFEAKTLLQTGGYRVYTSIDPRLEKRVEAALSDKNQFPPPVAYSYRNAGGRAVPVQAQEQAGIVALENGTRRILALGGGRDFQVSEVDHTTTLRQPGSLLKPLVVYGPAIEKGLVTPASVVDDAPRHYYDPNARTHDWFPLNWDGKFHGLMTVRDALMQSYNVPAIDIIGRLGTELAAGYGRALGLHDIAREDEESLGLAIGGIRGGVSPLQLAGAYATLPAGGIYSEPTLIDRIEDASGHTLYERTYQPARVFSPTTAYLLTHMLESVIASPYGTAHRLAALARPGTLAGKTGTTDDNRDAWFVGYTPRLTMSVWVGYDIPHPLRTDGSYHENARPARLFGRILAPDLRIAPTFPMPGGVRRYHVCTKSGDLAGPLCIAAHDDEWDVLADDSAPRAMCRMHRLVLTTRVDGKRVLATEFTPPDEIAREILIDRPPENLRPEDVRYTPEDLDRAIPAQADPRGGWPLADGGDSGDRSPDENAKANP